jgi:hypothetical protein
MAGTSPARTMLPKVLIIGHPFRVKTLSLAIGPSGLSQGCKPTTSTAPGAANVQWPAIAVFSASEVATLAARAEICHLDG